MDSAVALGELSTINRAASQPDGADGPPDQAGQVAGNPVWPDPADPVAAMTDNDGLVEIGRYAARLAAFERTVLPVAEQRLDDGQARVGPLREGGQQLTVVLHWLDRHLTGDVRAATWPGTDLSQDVQAAVAHYAELERDVIGQLAKALNENDMTELIRSYHQAEQVAPTRPHPNLSYDGALGRLKFRLAGLIDDVRDGTDTRPAGPVVGADATQALASMDGDTEGGDATGRAAVDSGSRPGQTSPAS